MGGGGTLGQVTKAVTGGLGSVGSALGGDSKNAGILGVGQYKANGIDINNKAFTDTKAQDALKAQFANQMLQANARKAQQVAAGNIGAERINAAQIDPSQQAQFRGGQAQLVSDLQAQAAGNGPSLAQDQLRQGTDRNIAQAMALQASQRGTNAASGMRNIAQNTALANQQAAQQAATLRVQEQLAGREQLGNVLGAARGQDIGLASTDAQLLQQANMANQATGLDASKANQAANLQAAMSNQNASLQQQNLNDAQSRFFNQGQMSLADQNRAAAMALEQLKVGQNNAISGVNSGAYQAASKGRSDLVGNLGGGLMGMAMPAADGGTIPYMADGGQVTDQIGGLIPGVPQIDPMPPSHLSPMMPTPGVQIPMAGASPMSEPSATKGLMQSFAQGVMDYQKQKNDQPQESGQAKEGKAMAAGIMKLAPLVLAASDGAKIPGDSPYMGDDQRNDKVPVMMSPGEVAVPRTIAQDPHSTAAFVQALNAMPKPQDPRESQNQALLAKAFARLQSRGVA